MSKKNSRKWLLDRRHMLRGMGASLALPLLDCMRPALSATPEAPAAKRSVFVYVPNGVNTLTWQIQQAGSDYEFTAPLKSLEKHRAAITPIS